MADYYELLGVPRTASGEEIKRAYRRKARELHPDANPDDTATTERFKEVARAYQVLSDPDQRARYDRFGEAGVGGAGAGPRMEDVFGGGGLNDIFDAFFGGQSPFGGGGRRGPSGPPRGQDLEVVADISFEQAVFGATVPVTLRLPQRCDGVWRQRRRCRHPAGDVRRLQRLGPGAAGPPEPPRTDGDERPMPTLRRSGAGRGHAVRDVPRRGPRHGRAHLPGRRPGRRRQRVDAAPQRHGARPVRAAARPATCTSTCASRRTSATAATATTSSPTCRSRSPRRRWARRSTLPTLDGDEELVVPAGTQPGREFVLRSRGVPRLQGRGRGDLRAQLVVEVPTKLDDEEAALLRQLAEKRGEFVNPPDKGLFSRIKSAFS